MDPDCAVLKVYRALRSSPRLEQEACVGLIEAMDRAEIYFGIKGEDGVDENKIMSMIRQEVNTTVSKIVAQEFLGIRGVLESDGVPGIGYASGESQT